jgi:hypothetical protein
MGHLRIEVPGQAAEFALAIGRQLLIRLALLARRLALAMLYRRFVLVMMTKGMSLGRLPAPMVCF